MPIGMIVMNWDQRVGPQVLASYPEEMSITPKTLMQVYSAHEYSGEMGLISFLVGALNIASYYSGEEKSLYVLLLLSLDEDPDAYEGGLANASRAILQTLDDESFLSILPSLFHRISVYPSLNNEQKLATIYFDDIKRMIINILREEGVIFKSELMIWLKDADYKGSKDLDGILFDLIKIELVKEASVKGMPSELIFLINDILMIRIPPIELVENPAEHGLPKNFINDYLTYCNKFFQNYRPSEEDNFKLIELLIDPHIYDVLRLLRTSIATRDDFEKLKKKGVEDISKILTLLWENQMIQVFKDTRGKEYYALVSDFYLTRIFPKYLLTTISLEYENKSKGDKVLIEYLNILENTYLDIKPAGKIKD